MNHSVSKTEFYERVEKWLSFMSYVEWDRLIKHEVNGDLVLKIYGWIDREDQYKDFVVVKASQVNVNIELLATSSSKYSERLHKDLHGDLEGHTDCNRVENYFNIDNMITTDT